MTSSKNTDSFGSTHIKQRSPYPIDALRGTGRTTRMLQKANLEASDGKPVFIFFHNIQQVHYALRLVADFKPCHLHQHHFRTAHDRLEYLDMTKGLPDRRIFVDHFLINKIQATK